MKRALELAKKGLGTTRPNPSVGAVLVVDNKIIGEGFTSPYGGHHAEVNAINSVQDKKLLHRATLYVTLEPCAHFGNTPPCSLLIVKSKIPRVQIGCIDSNAKVAGKGIDILRESGCDVSIGLLEEECREHHRRFFTFHEKNRPYVILKWAETKDGFIAPISKDEQKPVWISSYKARQLTHQWRSEEHAILVGSNTVIQDNPSLTTRHVRGNNPIRIVVDTKNSLSHNFKIFNDKADTHVLNDQNPAIILKELFNRSIQSVIIEGGTKTLQSFIDGGLWDEARVFVGDVEFGNGITAPVFQSSFSKELKIDTDILRLYRND